MLLSFPQVAAILFALLFLKSPIEKSSNKNIHVNIVNIVREKI